MVPDLLEDGHRLGGGGRRSVVPAFRVAGAKLDDQAHQRRMGDDASGTRGFAARNRLTERILCFAETPGLQHCLAGFREELEPALDILREERVGALEQVRGGRRVAARERPASRRGQPPGAVGTERAAVVVERPELGQIAMRLLEVVAEDLLVLRRALAVDAVGPLDELLVERGPRALEDRVVGGVANEDVVEAEGVLLRPRVVRANELLLGERVQVDVELGLHALRREVLRRPPVRRPGR